MFLYLCTDYFQKFTGDDFVVINYAIKWHIRISILDTSKLKSFKFYLKVRLFKVNLGFFKLIC